MLLSIIIPVYNVEPYLRECLDSVFAQDLTDCEVIAVNDGSTDGSCNILRKYKELYADLLTIINQPNGGLSSARNTGMVQAAGDYCYFLDSDDYLKSHAIASIRRAVSVSENADVIYLDCIVTDKGKRWERQEEKSVPVMDFRSFFQYAYAHKIGISPNAVAYVYSCGYWKRAGLRFEEGIKYEDALFKYRLFVRDDGTIKMIHVEEPFYVYRVGREGSLSTRLTLKNFKDLKFIREQMAQLFLDNGLKDISFWHALYGHGLSVLLEAYKNGFLNQRREFWSRQDWKWMRQGVANREEYSLCLLARINPHWMARYYYYDLPKMVRRVINIIFSLAIKLLYGQNSIHCTIL